MNGSHVSLCLVMLEDLAYSYFALYFFVTRCTFTLPLFYAYASTAKGPKVLSGKPAPLTTLHCGKSVT